MLESLPACPSTNYPCIVNSSKGITSLAPQLNYITDVVLELKTKLTKIKTEVKELKNKLAVVHLFLNNAVRHSEKSTSSISAPFQHKYPFQHPKNKNPFPLQDIKIQKEVGENLVVHRLRS